MRGGLSADSNGWREEMRNRRNVLADLVNLGVCIVFGGWRRNTYYDVATAAWRARIA